MKLSNINSATARTAQLLTATLAGLLVGGCASSDSHYCNQTVFDRPEDAAKQLNVALASGQASELDALFGSDASETLASGDPVADRWNRQILATAMSERWVLESDGPATKEVVIGYESWPFPIPLVKDDRGWWFDTVAGHEEVLARRIGRNELATIASLNAFVDAERQYASTGHDGKPAGVFAQKIHSDSGTHNGLYWSTPGAKEPPSPMGEFIARAAAKGYNKDGADGETPYHGYYFRILTSQGPAAPGGAKSYIVGDSMTGGFAMIACPAMYRSSGVMTFIVGPDGVVRQADLGTDTPAAAAAITAFDPTDRWDEAE